MVQSKKNGGCSVMCKPRLLCMALLVYAHSLLDVAKTHRPNQEETVVEEICLVIRGEKALIYMTLGKSSTFFRCMSSLTCFKSQTLFFGLVRIIPWEALHKKDGKPELLASRVGKFGQCEERKNPEFGYRLEQCPIAWLC